MQPDLPWCECEDKKLGILKHDAGMEREDAEALVAAVRHRPPMCDECPRRKQC